MIPRTVLPILLAFTLCVPHIAHAKGKKREVIHHDEIIEAVSSTSITTQITNGGPGEIKTYKITKDTEITFKGQTVTADELRAGQSVDVTPDAADDSVAGQIVASDPPQHPGAKKK
jgi:hypothetical protein